MKIIKTLEEIPELDEAYVTIGNFDGIHLGHQKIISTMLQEAQGKPTIVLTFRESPVKLLRPEMFMGYILPTQYKKKIMKDMGVKTYVDLHLYDVMPMSADEFILFLVERIKKMHLYVGYNFRYGNRNLGDVKTLDHQSRRLNFELSVFDKVTWKGKDVNSTAIRRLIKEGELQEAEEMLTRPYFYHSRTMSGDGIGKKIGYPTINMEQNSQVLPSSGIFFSYMAIGKQLLPSMSYIGNRPTIDGKEMRIETNILDYEREVPAGNYDLVFIQKIREEKRLNNLDELAEILYNDKLNCQALSKGHVMEKEFVEILCGGN